MMIVPLILAAVISGVASLGDVRRLGRLGAATVVYYLATTAAAVLIGLVMVNVIRPGAGLGLTGAGAPGGLGARQSVGLGDLVLNVVDPNLIQAAADMKLLPLILFAILFSSALTTLGARGRHVIAFFEGVNEAVMKLVIWIMYLAPAGIFALVASRLGQAGGSAFFDQIAAVGWHVATVLSGLAVQAIVLILIMRFVGGRGPAYLIGRTASTSAPSSSCCPWAAPST
jgi:Na+/H+-dicarboxylate symporter